MKSQNSVTTEFKVFNQNTSKMSISTFNFPQQKKTTKPIRKMEPEEKTMKKKYSIEKKYKFHNCTEKKKRNENHLGLKNIQTSTFHTIECLQIKNLLNE